MLLRLVRPVRRKGSSVPYFVQRIPADVRDRAAGLKLSIPLGDKTVLRTISPRADTIRLSLRTHDPSEAKTRQAGVAAYFERIWQVLRQDQPVRLPRRQVHALAGELYRAWADEERGRRITLEHGHTGWQQVYETPQERKETWEAVLQNWVELGETGDTKKLEREFGPVVDRQLLRKGIKEVDPETRHELLWAFWQAFRDGFEANRRIAGGDYSPDPNAGRFPRWEETAPQSVSAPSEGRQSLRGLVEDWWKEADATGLSKSTHVSYRNTFERLIAFLGHDDATRVTAEDVVRFKDHRLAEVNPKTRKPISAKTVKDSDLAGLKSIFGWAVSNHRSPANPAEGITIKLPRKHRLRSKGFTEEEASAVLSRSLSHKRGHEHPKTFAAKRWIPWLCAYTGARVGEVAQLRKQDVRLAGGHWFITITPEAGAVKTKEARQVPLHSHLVELGFPDFIKGAPKGYLFLSASRREEVEGPRRGVTNRVREFVRKVVPDPNVAPNHAWRHLFKTKGREAGIEERILDAICGHAPATVGASYGEVSRTTLVRAMESFPRFGVSGTKHEPIALEVGA